MNVKAEHLSQIEYLLVRYFDGTLEKDEMERLDAFLRSDVAAQEYYFDYLKTYLALKQSRSFDFFKMSERSDYQEILEEMAQYENSATAVEKEKPTPARILIQKVERPQAVFRTSKAALYTAILSSAALLLMILLVQIAPTLKEAPVAHLDRAVEAQWENVSGKITEGDALSAGPMKLVQGFVEITFKGGGSVIMQGPAEFTLESPHQIFLQSGRLTATLRNPRGQTFVVRSSFGSVVDYGTEFGVYVGPGGTAETYVFQGKVQLRDSSDPVKFDNSLFLEEGQGAVTEISGGVVEILHKEVDFRQFVRSEELLLRHQAAEGSSYHRWLAYMYFVQRDPSLAAYYRCEKDSLRPDEAINSAPTTGDSLSGIFGAPGRPETVPSWTEGRWPQTTALQFDRSREQRIRVPDHPRLRIAGPITLAAWIKIPAAEDAQGGMLLSNRTLNNINYQLVLGKRPSVGKMVLAFGRYATHLDPKVHSELVNLAPETWHHIAVTHDNRTVQYYIDGRLTVSIPHVFRQDPVAAEMYIGFTPVAQSAGFHGVLGELLIFDRALSEQELLSMYLQTKP